LLVLITFFEPYSIESSGSKKSNSSVLKEILEGSDVELLLVVEIDGGVTLSLENVVAKLAATLVAMISTIFVFSLAILPWF